MACGIGLSAGNNDGTTLSPTEAKLRRHKAATLSNISCVEILKDLTSGSVTLIDTNKLNREGGNLLLNIRWLMPNIKEIKHIATGGESAVYELVFADGTPKKIVKISAKFNDSRVEKSYQSEIEIYKKIKEVDPEAIQYIAEPEQLLDIPNVGKGLIFNRSKWLDLNRQLLRFSYQKRKGYPIENALINLKAWRQIAVALRGLHRAGLLHRDVKPANILVSEDPLKGFILQLTDFGIARNMYDSFDKLAGTLSHMPPEQVRGEPSNTTHDLYSMKVTFVEMLMGESIWKWKVRDPGVLVQENFQGKGTYPLLKGIPKEVIQYSHPGVLRVLNLDYKKTGIEEYVRVIDEEIKNLEAQILR